MVWEGGLGAYAQTANRELLYVRTNILLPATNFGVEYCFDEHWSIAADYYTPWLLRHENHKNCNQLIGGNLEGRYWFGKDRTYEDRLEGHSVSMNVAGGYYDFERNYFGKQGEFISVGVDYLYALPIFNDIMHIEFSIGLGYLYSFVQPYNVYEDGGLAFKTGYTERFSWWGPTKAAVSLVLPIQIKRRAEK